MTLPSGQISFSQVNTEILRSSTAALSLNDSTVRSLAGRPSGAIGMNNLQGKTYVRYGTPSGSFAVINSTTWNVYLAISNGMPNASFYIELTYTTSGLPYPGYIAVVGDTTTVGALDSSGNWSRTYNVFPDPPAGNYWKPAPQTNYFDFFQGPVGGGIGSGTYIGSIVLSS